MQDKTRTRKTLVDELNALRQKLLNFEIRETQRRKTEDPLDKLEARVKQRTAKLVETDKKLKRETKDRKLVQEAPAESEEKYRLVVENANEAILIAQDGLLKFVNSKAKEIIGYSAQEMISRPFIDFIYHDDREVVLQRFQRRLPGEPLPKICPFRAVDSEGNLNWVEMNVVTVNSNGRPATFNSIADIT
jgi:PAS domain S-box-containing protein